LFYQAVGDFSADASTSPSEKNVGCISHFDFPVKLIKFY